jgi:hypothetical protein
MRASRSSWLRGVSICRRGTYSRTHTQFLSRRSPVLPRIMENRLCFEQAPLSIKRGPVNAPTKCPAPLSLSSPPQPLPCLFPSPLLKAHASRLDIKLIVSLLDVNVMASSLVDVVPSPLDVEVVVGAGQVLGQRDGRALVKLEGRQLVERPGRRVHLRQSPTITVSTDKTRDSR